MFRDSLFYPLAICLVAAIVAIAMLFGGGAALPDEQIARNGWSLSGTDLDKLTVSPGSDAQYVSDDGGYVRLSQHVPIDVEPPSIGVFATLGPSLERVFAGKRLRMTFRARSSAVDPLRTFMAAYVPLEAGPSDWTNFELGPEWADYSFEFSPPATDAEENVDLVAVFPGRLGRSQNMDLAFIRVDVMAEP
ncbi:hypothetical protein [uncultured Algimonas sp.]|uniref:hypothetical protein n=1 Tax=uncultured Algimonas sp. TaxID=1547920 RepID=UPI00262EFA9B|nr:hypothetical protein [uncultured Algimonas sp.]